MFGQYFYHRMIRTYVAYFGTLFNNIECRRFDKDKNTTARFRVPLTYASRDYYRQRILGDPNLDRKPNVVLPRMGFLISGIQYDLSRKLNPLNHFRGISGWSTDESSDAHSLRPQFRATYLVQNYRGWSSSSRTDNTELSS